MRKEEPDLLSADMRMDLLRQKWEQQVPWNFIYLIMKLISQQLLTALFIWIKKFVYDTMTTKKC